MKHKIRLVTTDGRPIYHEGDIYSLVPSIGPMVESEATWVGVKRHALGPVKPKRSAESQLGLRCKWIELPKSRVRHSELRTQALVGTPKLNGAWIWIKDQTPKNGQCILVATMIGKLSKWPSVITWNEVAASVVEREKMADLHWLPVPALDGNKWNWKEAL